MKKWILKVSVADLNIEHEVMKDVKISYHALPSVQALDLGN